MRLIACLALCVTLIVETSSAEDAAIKPTVQDGKHEFTTADDSDLEYTNDQFNLNMSMEELSANADGVEIFMIALEDVVLEGGDSVKIPAEIDPEEHNITLEDALDRLEDFLDEQMKFSQDFLNEIESELENAGKKANTSALQDAKEQILDIMDGFTSAKQDVGDYRKSISIDQMYDYYGDDEERRDEGEDEKALSVDSSETALQFSAGDDEGDSFLAGFDEDPAYTDKKIAETRLEGEESTIPDPLDLETTHYPYINDAFVADEDYSRDDMEVYTTGAAVQSEGNEAEIGLDVIPYGDDAIYETEEAILDDNVVPTTAPSLKEELEKIFVDVEADNDNDRYSLTGFRFRTTSAPSLKDALEKHSNDIFRDVEDDDSVIGFRFPTRVYIAIAVPLGIVFISFIVFFAYVYHSKRRARIAKAKSLEEVKTERRISVVSICDAHNFQPSQPVGSSSLPSYLDVISERVEPGQT